MIDAYLAALRKTPLDDHTEMTGRAALEALLNTMIVAYGPEGAIVTHEAKHLKGNAPDFKISLHGQIIAYVETKAVGEKLSAKDTQAQVERYRRLCPNVLLTDYLPFELYADAPKSLAAEPVRLGEMALLIGKPMPPRPERVSELTSLIKRLLSHPPQGLGRARDLAHALAIRAHLLRDYLTETLTAQAATGSGDALTGLYHAFKAQVSRDLTLQEFADAYAQTLAYGLFLAKLNAETTVVTLANAKGFVPVAVPLLRELVGFLDRLDEPAYADIRWVVDEVLSIVNGLKLNAIVEDLSFRNRKPRGHDVKARSEAEWRLFSRDPFIYFYEDFLKAYDAETRKGRGVYYTPPPVVSFIVRAVHDILKDTFGITTGLADRERVTVLDFACGTGTFLVEVMEQIFAEVGGTAGGKAQAYVDEHLLKNLFGFEFLVAPYTIAHLKLSQYLRDAQLCIPNGGRFQVYLTNTVEPMAVQGNFLLPALSKETEAAATIKKKPILVITGNPPYSGHSKNNGPVAKGSIAGYKTLVETGDDGKERTVPLGEKNLKWLQDDYVKFIRFAQMKMDVVDEGVVAVITNHSFLDNPTFRGMRQSLMRSFDQIPVIDLHGNSKKKEIAPDGSKDENVFDIEQGVAISLFVKKPGIERGVWRGDVWGKRQEKYEWAARTGMDAIEWTSLWPAPPHLLFVDRDNAGASLYEEEWAVPAIFPVSSVGIVTARDHLAINFDLIEMRSKLATFASAPVEEARSQFKLGQDVRDWRVTWAQSDLKDIQGGRIREQKIAYRPFDERWTVYTGRSRGFHCYPREAVMRNMVEPNVALVTSRLTKGETFKHVAVTDKIVEVISLSPKTSNNGFVFPLYLYPPLAKTKPTKKAAARKAAAVGDMIAEHEATPLGPFAGKTRIENIAPEFRTWLDARYGTVHSPETLLGYIYAVLHAPAYRARYADFLRSDFPRIPFPADNDSFVRLAALGEEIIAAHLLRDVPSRGLGTYIGKGDNTVLTYDWQPVDHRLVINSSQYFADVPQAVWEFTIGGYQVLRQYLRARKGRVLTLGEIESVEKVVNVLDFTIDRMAEIDREYIASFEEKDEVTLNRHS